MRLGIIGAGMVGHFHAQAINAMRNGEFAGVACRTAERASALVDKHGGKAYANVDALLADDAIDIVVIGTPSGTHGDLAARAAVAGKHVLVEKPMEITTARIDRIVDACDRAGVVLGAVLNRRFHPAIRAIEAALAAGRFGKLTLCSAYVKWWRTQAYYDDATWRGTRALDGGGALINQAIHTIDQLLHFAGPVRKVTALTGRVGHERIEVEDVATASLEFENGALGTIEATTAAWGSRGHPCEVHLCGTRGGAFLADDRLRHWEFAQPTDEDDRIRAELMADGAAGLGAADPGAIDPDMHRQNFEHFVEAVRGNEPLRTGAPEARRAVQLVEAVYRSAELGRPVEM